MMKMKQREFAIKLDNSKEDYVNQRGLLVMLNTRVAINKMNQERLKISFKVREEKVWEQNKLQLNFKKNI